MAQRVGKGLRKRGQSGRCRSGIFFGCSHRNVSKRGNDRTVSDGDGFGERNGRGLGETVGEIFLRELSLVEINRRIRTLYGDEGLSRGCHDSHSFEFVRPDFAYN